MTSNLLWRCSACGALAYPSECREAIIGQGKMTTFGQDGKPLKIQGLTQSALVCPIHDCGGKMEPREQTITGDLF